MPNKFIFDGRLADAVDLTRRKDKVVATFTLLRNEFAGREEDTDEVKERLVRCRFTAFGRTAESIAEHTRKGDQLIVESSIRNNDYTANDGVKHYEFNFVVDRYDFGQYGHEKREIVAARQAASA